MTGPHKPGLMPALADWLKAQGIEHEVHEHDLAFTATGTARAEGVDPHSFAKVVWVRSDEGGEAFMVIDAVDHLDLTKAATAMNSRHVKLVPEDEIQQAAPDCEVGAMPAVGRLFEVPTFADHALARDPEISFNGGSHRVSVRVDRSTWERAAGVTYRDLAAHSWREPNWTRS
jgi:Ala-tRNA(Pro) deacylase